MAELALLLTVLRSLLWVPVRVSQAVSLFSFCECATVVLMWVSWVGWSQHSPSAGLAVASSWQGLCLAVEMEVQLCRSERLLVLLNPVPFLSLFPGSVRRDRQREAPVVALSC